MPLPWPDEVREWMSLGLRTRREVLRLAKRGQRHPDGRVSSIAFGWSMWRLRRYHSYSLGQMLVSMIGLLIGVGYLIRGDGPTAWLLLALLGPLLIPLERRRLQRAADANGFRVR